MTTTATVDVPNEEPAPSGGRRRAARVVGIIAGLALVIAVALAIVANRPVIVGAAVSGLLVVLLVVLVIRARRRARWILIGAVVLIALAGVLATTYLLSARQGPTSGAALPVQTVEYHAEGRVVGGVVEVDERIVLDDRMMAVIAAGTRSAEDPEVQVAGWHEDGSVDGFPAFARTRTVVWDRTSILADTARVPVDIGSLSATAGDGHFTAELSPASGSRLDIAVPKGSLGSSVPPPTARTGALAGGSEETVGFTIDRYDPDVSFDVLRPPLRNPAGHAIYDASLWGFWQWTVGVIGAVVSGLIVDKLGEALWRPLAALLRRRRTPTPAT